MVVTTRSAERRLQASGKTDILALRTKNEEASPSPKPSGLRTSTQGSPRAGSRISVHVPPLRKRTQLGHSMTPGDQDVAPTQPSSSLESRESVSHTEASDLSNLTASFGTLEGSEILTQPDSLEEALSSQSTPKQVDVEEPTIEQQPASVRAVEADVGSVVADASLSEHDEDEAPEVLSSNATKPKKSLRGKRRTGINHAATTKTVTLLEKTEVAISTPTQEFSTPSLLKLDTTHVKNLETEPRSDDSSDSAFVTARTHRHKDMLTTPSQSSPNTDVSIFAERAPESIDRGQHQPGQRLRNPNKTSIDPIIDETPKLKQVSRIVESKTTTLPRKAGNTLESYRRQLLLNRAEKSGKRGNGTFKLEHEWAHKKRKFVVGPDVRGKYT